MCQNYCGNAEDLNATRINLQRDLKCVCVKPIPNVATVFLCIVETNKVCFPLTVINGFDIN